MRKFNFMKICLFYLFLISTIVYCQTGNEFYYNSLFYTCKVWGYLKYFHTSNAEKKANWDDILITNLSSLKGIKNSSDFNKYLEVYFTTLGEMQTTEIAKPNIAPELRYNLNTNWFTNENFNVTTTNKLKEIEDKFRPRTNYYISGTSVGNPDFKNDTQYYTQQNTTEELRLLGLFRYWNIINYFYPYKNLLDKDWDDVLKQMIPKIISCKDETDYNRVIMELAVNITDAHATSSSPVISKNIRGSYYLPLELKFIDGKTVITRIGSGINDLNVGDCIIAIDNVPIEKCRDNVRSIIHGSNPASKERNINFQLISFKQNSIPVSLEIENAKGTSKISLFPLTSTDYQKALEYSSPAWQVIHRNGRKYGVINMGILEVSQIPAMFGELWDCSALIFDIRNYPKGTMWYMINYLFPGKIMVARFTSPDINYPGTLRWSYAEVGSGDFSKNYKKRIYLLFDEETQSQAEYTIMALEQHPKAVKIGSQTAGADGNISYMYLPGGITTIFTGLGVFYPDYRPTQRIGIVPDIVVRPTVEGIRAGKDEVLEAAFSDDYSEVWSGDVPISFSLSQNFPNPFNPGTTIEFAVPNNEIENASSFHHITLKIYDMLGRELQTLVDEEKKAGYYQVTFDAQKYSSGVYFYTLRGPGVNMVKKMMLLK